MKAAQRQPYTKVPAVVYIIHSAAGKLLYVGVTRNLRQRMAGHKARSSWWSPDVVISEELFERRADADRREAELIEHLRPPFNPPPRRILAITGELRATVERVAASRGMTMTALVEEALRREIARVERLQQRAAE